jgi:hypothetical protein
LATGACWPVYNGFRRVNNPPQVANLPHEFCRIPIRTKTMWHWARLPAPPQMQNIADEKSLRHLGGREAIVA